VNGPAALDRLSTLCGIAPDYEDIWGKRHPVSDETRRALLSAMGLPADTDSALGESLERFERRRWRRALAPVRVVRESAGDIEIQVSLPAIFSQRRFHWRLTLETGERHEGEAFAADLRLLEEARLGGASFKRHAWRLPIAPGFGYHELEIQAARGGQELRANLRLIVAPDRCYRPAALAAGGRIWGPAVQLYSVRSRRNWGMGDFTDLRGLVEFAASAGAGIVGVSPLHALFPHEPGHASPYGPSSRLHLNVLYIDVEAVADFAESAEVRASVQEPEFQARLRALRGAELVDYSGVAGAKLSVLERLYRHFRDLHLEPESERGRAFRAYQAARGEGLRGLALFHALEEHFRRADPAAWRWQAWPDPFRDNTSPEVSAFATERRERVEFYEYLQWQAELQLAAAGHRSWELGLGVGIYGDLAVGVDRGGADAWMRQDLHALEAGVGAPPDDFCRRGQDWGLPPWIPHRLVDAAYEPFIATLRANMRHMGALRVDHVMGLMRLFWVPAGGSPAEGAYVSYPFQDLLGILALESQRNRCLVIGEDLGTVAEELRETLADQGVLSYHPLFFEKDAAGAFKAPRDFPRDALVTVSTHDLPTLSGYWRGQDLDLRATLGLFMSKAQRQSQVVARAEDRARLLVALEREALLPAGASVHQVANPVMTAEMARAVHVYLARAPSRVMMVQLEDILGQVDQANLPGTRAEQHPNWRRKLTLDVEDWRDDPRVSALREALRGVRGSMAEPKPGPAAPRAQSQIPLATYRLQFNKDFTFAQATEVVPYLHALGVSHCYASPFLKARAGSPHGYDIVDHNAVNPEIGTEQDLDRLLEALHAHGMGLIIDVVPNHMGVLGRDNAWWLDVLENGPASAYAAFFDIDWTPLKEELWGKVLLPVLGDHYGRVLENGELRLDFDAARAQFSVRYNEHRFPIDPREYPRILERGIERLRARLGDKDIAVMELQALIAALCHLPAREETSPEKIGERARDKEIHKRRLAELCASSPDIALFIGENVAQLNGSPGNHQSFDDLHQLIKAQAFRLAYWRVASDDINYRRFFDINDLAGLRMENPAVFEATHRLVLRLVRSDRPYGLRIDHPDGLYDPGEYFRRLQRGFAGLADTEAAPGKPLYLVMEKIVRERERLPEGWPVHGTTGYRFANIVNGLFVDAASADKMVRIYAAFTGERTDFEELVYTCKKLIIRNAMASELNVLASELSRIALSSRHTCDYTLNSLRDALTEVVACFPVYRTYIVPGRVSEQDRRYIDWAVAVARKRSQAADVTVFDFVKDALTTDLRRGRSDAHAERVTAFAMKFQQYTGPVMAKGMEDTAFYRYHALVSLNDVGGDPRAFGFPVSAFHGASQDRARNWPHTMVATSTHDSKRSEDVRARIDVLSEMPAAWRLSLRKWSRLNRSKKTDVDGRPAPSRDDEYLLYQTLIGAWPGGELGDQGLDAFRLRIERYMLKAVREAKVHSSWINPNPDYERALAQFVGALLNPGERNLFLSNFVPAHRRIARLGMFNSLAATLIKIASPGVPDIYQGNEILEFGLVDPDNRRAVDYRRRRLMLDRLAEMVDAAGPDLPQRVHALLEDSCDGQAKLYLTWRALQCRREHPDVFRGGEYLPLAVRGARTEHACAFARREGHAVAVAIAPRLVFRLLDGAEGDPLGPVWGDTRIEVPPAEQGYTDIFTGRRLTPEPGDGGVFLSLAKVLAHFPVALLVRVAPGSTRVNA
jgi:malto-oligosyltrehalose synthase/4-alpha-glucanotransferase